MGFAQGRFVPKNPQKYAGDATNIMFRSSWEIAMMKFLDSSQAVIKWGSEELVIPYLKPVIDPVTGRPGFKPARYFPDFVVVYQDKDGNIQKEVLEVKPLKETLAEKAKSDRDKMALAVNIAKWKAAEVFCRQNGMKFRVITEQSLFKQGPKKQAKQAKKPAGTRKTTGTTRGAKK
jgi:hypothetical protein